MSISASKNYSEINTNLFEVLITPNDYHDGNQLIPSPDIFYIKVRATGSVGPGAPITSYNIKLQTDENGKDNDPFINIENVGGQSFVLSGENLDGISTLPSLQAVEESVTITGPPFEIELQIISNEVFHTISTQPYKIGDAYRITIQNPLQQGAQVISLFSRNTRSIIDLPGTTGPIGPINPIALKICNGIEVPAINIDGQTLINGSDAGSMVFTIDDKYSYYKEKPISLDNKICTLDCITQDQLKQTIFEKCCPKMVSVVRGDDENNLQQKVNALWLKINNGQPFFDTIFYPTFIQYGMVKFILSRILYGYFDINFLLWKYNDKFLKDLSNSRFCNFIQYFEEQLFANFDQYFKYK